MERPMAMRTKTEKTGTVHEAWSRSEGGTVEPRLVATRSRRASASGPMVPKVETEKVQRESKHSSGGLQSGKWPK